MAIVSSKDPRIDVTRKGISKLSGKQFITVVLVITLITIAIVLLSSIFVS